MRQNTSRPLWTAGVAALGCFVLAACSTNKSDTAWELIQHQQEKQALVRQHEAETTRKNAPTEPEVLMSMIRETQNQQRYFASLAYIDAYAGQFGRNIDLDAVRANALRMTGQTDQSEIAYRGLLGTAQAAEGWHGLGLLAASRANYVQAAVDLDKAAKLQPTNAQILNDLGYARLHAGDLANARLPLGQAAELDPDNAKVLANLALLLLLEGKSAQAQTVMERAGLSEEARSQVYRLSSELHVNTASAPVVGNGYATPLPQQSMPDYFGHSPLLR